MAYRKTYELVGYAYEADIHCLTCTGKRFPTVLFDGATDNEGSPVTPVFLGDTEPGEYCGDCFQPIDA
jgi:hypothetical protein